MTTDHGARETRQTREAMIAEFSAARGKRGRSAERPTLVPTPDPSPRAVARAVVQTDRARPDSDKG